jgi:hypothetical protein
LDAIQRRFYKYKKGHVWRMNNLGVFGIIGFILMGFSAGWLGLAMVIGIPGGTNVGTVGVILFGLGLAIVIYLLSKLKSIEVAVVDEE